MHSLLLTPSVVGSAIPKVNFWPKWLNTPPKLAGSTSPSFAACPQWGPFLWPTRFLCNACSGPSYKHTTYSCNGFGEKLANIKNTVAGYFKCTSRRASRSEETRAWEFGLHAFLSIRSATATAAAGQTDGRRVETISGCPRARSRPTLSQRPATPIRQRTD